MPFVSNPPLALVINPYAVDFKLYDEWMHPLGLYFLIDLLRQNGFEVCFFNALERTPHERSKKFNTGDFYSEEIEKPSLYRSIPRKFKRYGRPLSQYITYLESTRLPDIICIGSMMTYWLPGAAFTARIAAQTHPNVPIVIGGIAARLMAEAIRFMLPDPFYVNSSGLKSAVTLHPSMPPLTIKSPLTLRSGLGLLDRPFHGPILSSLGCPMGCSYCASALLQGAFHRRPLETIVNEATFLAGERNVIDFALYDDAFLYDPDNSLFSLLDAFERLHHPIRLHAPNGLHLRYINDRLASRLKAARFSTLRFGYESGNTKHSIDTSGKSSRTEVSSKIASLRMAGFMENEIGVYVMAGLPDQTPSQVMEEIDFLLSLGVKPKPVWLSPLPGTRLFEYYAHLFPQITNDPLWHNDTFFVTQFPGWGWDTMEKIRSRASINSIEAGISTA
jgi:hypothetical protein